jgi:hypothetical protein
MLSNVQDFGMLDQVQVQTVLFLSMSIDRKGRGYTSPGFDTNLKMSINCQQTIVDSFLKNKIWACACAYVLVEWMNEWCVFGLWIATCDGCTPRLIIRLTTALTDSRLRGKKLWRGKRVSRISISCDLCMYYGCVSQAQGGT